MLIPSSESLAHRARIASLISPLKRIRPRVPFYELASHRIPTLWSLYRGLLREAPGYNIRFRIRMLFRKNEHLTSPAATCVQLLKGHKWHDTFIRARDGDTKFRAILLRYDNILAAKREKERWKHIFRAELAWQEKLKKRPIVTGSPFRPTHFNRALPRLHPQPAHISGMIHARRRARSRRLEQGKELLNWMWDLRSEAHFESHLPPGKVGARTRVYGREVLDEWLEPLKDKYETLLKTYRLDEERLRSGFSVELLEQLKNARRDKVVNKTREKTRERKGEILRSTFLRRRQLPPAHILSNMTPSQKKLYKIARGSLSEVGYVGAVKKKLGWKLKDSWLGERLEVGEVEKRPWLDLMGRSIERENERRRVWSDETTS